MPDNEMRDWMNFMILSCKKATYFIEKRQVSSLSFKEKLQLTLHTSVCDACKSYEKQSSLINKAIVQWVFVNKQKNKGLSPKVKEQILQKLEKI